MNRQGYSVNKSVMHINNQQSGFTLIELMVALTLGLLISAAALQVFYTSSVNNNRQAAGSQLQDNAVFGMDDFSRHLRRANYGAKSNTTSGFYLNHLTPQGGIVLTRAEETTVTSGTPPVNTIKWTGKNLSGLKNGNAPLPNSILSTNASTNSASSIAGVANSDQLTIQYQAYQEGMFTCDGIIINKDDYVIERYFVRNDTTVIPNQTGLACASLTYTYSDATALGGIDVAAKVPKLVGNGTIVIPNIDYFRVLLGTTAQDNFATKPGELALVYQSIPTDPAASLAGRRIVSVQVGMLTHSETATISKQDNASLRFNILDKRDQQLNTAAKAGSKYLRDVYETTTLIRNARGKS